MKKILKYITLLIITVMCASCEERIDGDTLIVVSEREYGDRSESKEMHLKNVAETLFKESKITKRVYDVLISYKVEISD